MTNDKPQRSVLVIGRSQLVLDDTVAELRRLGYRAQSTNDLSPVTGRFDTKAIDLVVFGGQVPPPPPPDRKAELRERSPRPTPRSSSSRGSPAFPA